MRDEGICDMSNEKTIRLLCKELFLLKYPNATIVDEFTCDSLCTRNDLFIVDDSKDIVLSIEIKSDRDNLKRLYKQVTDYKTYSNIVYAILDIKHLKKYNNSFRELPEFKDVGLIIYDNGNMVLEKSAKVNKFPKLLKLLRTNELNIFSTGLKGRSKIPGNAKYLKKMINNVFGEDAEIIARSIFMHRIGKEYNPKPVIHDDKIKKLILSKQQTFTNYIKE